MNQQQLIEQKAKAILQNSFDKNIKPLIPITFKEAEGENGYNWIYEAMQEYGEWMQGEGERLRECSNARKNEILRLREALDELAEELEKKTESASMWAKKAMEAGLERNQLAAEVERLKGERDSLRIAAEALLNGLSKEHSGGKAIPRSIHVILKIKALKEVLAPKPQTEQP